MWPIGRRVITIPMALAPTRDRIPPVATILGQVYRLGVLIGKGGAANVFEATDLRNGQSVAVKVLVRSGEWNPEILARFQREVSVTAAISSPHVVHVLDAGWDAAFGIYLVMERLRGLDLRQYLATHGRMEPRVALQMASEAALGLAAAHAVGVVHRDLKPSNIYLAEHPTGGTIVKIVDFGIAKVLGDRAIAASGSGAARLTLPGATIGTPHYMAPEQIQSPEGVTEATDTYALGAVLYEALAGEPVIRAGRSYAQVLVDVLTQPTPRLKDSFPEADASLDVMVTTMMHPDPARRTPAMAVLAQRLASLAATDLAWSGSRAPLSLRAEPRAELLEPPQRRSTLSKVAIAAGAAAIAVGVAAVTSNANSTEPPSTRGTALGVALAE